MSPGAGSEDKTLTVPGTFIYTVAERIYGKYKNSRDCVARHTVMQSLLIMIGR